MCQNKQQIRLNYFRLKIIEREGGGGVHKTIYEKIKLIQTYQFKISMFLAKILISCLFLEYGKFYSSDVSDWIYYRSW